MFDLHTIIKNNERAEQDARKRRMALIKSEIAKLNNSERGLILAELENKA